MTLATTRPQKLQTHVPLVRDIMKRQVISVPADMSVEELADVFTTHQISGVPVVDDDRNVIGVVSLPDIAVHSAHPQSALRQMPRRQYYRDLWLEEDDLKRGFIVEDYSSNVQVQDIMTPVIYQVREDDPVSVAVELMLHAKVHRVLVSRGRDIVGILTTMDLIALLPEYLPH